MTVRKHISISKDLNDWLIQKSKETGISQSSLVAMTIMEYKKEEEAISSMKPLLQELMNMKGADIENL